MDARDFHNDFHYVQQQLLLYGGVNETLSQRRATIRRESERMLDVARKRRLAKSLLTAKLRKT